MQRELLPFYLDGRGAKLGRMRKLCDSAGEIAKRVLAGEDLRPAVTAAVTSASKAYEADRKLRRTWMEENDGQRTDAYAAYCQGLADELVFALESEVMDVIDTEISEDDGEEDDDEDEDGDEEEDEDKAT